MDELWGQLKKAELGFLKWAVIIVIGLVVIALAYGIITRLKKGNDSGLYEDDEEEEVAPKLSRKEQKLAEEQVFPKLINIPFPLVVLWLVSVNTEMNIKNIYLKTES